MMQPVAHLLLANGVTYPQFVRALKATFLRAARAELRAADAPITDSALSLLSGVHRKDVRVMRDSDGPPPSRNRASSLAADVAARWMQAPEYLDEQGAPRRLSLRGRLPNESSFESLVQSVSKDFHARSVLDELLRLQVVRVENDQVCLRAEGLGTSDGFAAVVRGFAASAADHLSAGAVNLRAAARSEALPFFDHAVEIGGVSAHATGVLHAMTRELCSAALARIESEGRNRRAQESQGPGLPGEYAMRVRVGTFFYAEPVLASQPAATPSGAEAQTPVASPRAGAQLAAVASK